MSAVPGRARPDLVDECCEPLHLQSVHSVILSLSSKHLCSHTPNTQCINITNGQARSAWHRQNTSYITTFARAQLNQSVELCTANVLHLLYSMFTAMLWQATEVRCFWYFAKGLTSASREHRQPVGGAVTGGVTLLMEIFSGQTRPLIAGFMFDDLSSNNICRISAKTALLGGQAGR